MLVWSQPPPQVLWQRSKGRQVYGFPCLVSLVSTTASSRTQDVVIFVAASVKQMDTTDHFILCVCMCVLSSKPKDACYHIVGNCHIHGAIFRSFCGLILSEKVKTNRQRILMTSHAALTCCTCSFVWWSFEDLISIRVWRLLRYLWYTIWTEEWSQGSYVQMVALEIHEGCYFVGLSYPMRIKPHFFPENFWYDIFFTSIHLYTGMLEWLLDLPINTNLNHMIEQGRLERWVKTWLRVPYILWWRVIY